MKKDKTYIKKDFDAVKFMHDVREKISREISELTPEEIKAYFSIKNLKERIKPNA